MIPVDKAVMAKYSHSGKTFEILVDAEKTYEFKQGKNYNIDDMVAARDVYSDFKMGERASDADLNKAFGTNDFDRIFIKIVKDGEIHLTTEQKRKMLADRTKQLVALIARNAVDPRTHLPHPPARIEKALEESRYSVNAFKSAEEQVEAALKGIKPILPIKMETVRIAVRIPAECAMRAYGGLKEYKRIKEEWQGNGSLIAVVELPAGMQSDFFDKMNKLTQGNIESKVLETI